MRRWRAGVRVSPLGLACLRLKETVANATVRKRAESLFFEGGRYLLDGQVAAAERCLRAAIGLDAGFAEAHANLALLLDQSARKAEAERHYRQALALDPRDAQTHVNLGVMLAGLMRFCEAETHYREAIALNPDSPAAWSNLGVLLACGKREDEAEGCYRRALAIDAQHANAQFNLSYLLLRQGRYAEGWRCLEARDWYAPLERHLACPRWRGESLLGKTILIGVEAGHGDMIQFCRYAAVLKANGAAAVSVLCQPALARLFARADGVDNVLPIDRPVPKSDWDYWTPPFSIAYHCQTQLPTIPARLPYLHADPARVADWASRLAGEAWPGEKRVGLVWKGSAAFENDAERSLASLDVLAPLGDVPGVRFFSLQKGAGEEQARRPPPGFPLVDLGAQLGDFAETAAVIENLDLTISVDTAVAHLAGALARPCWVLLPDYKTDWRWLAGRSDSPWYPGVLRLFRQPPGGGWDAVVAEVQRALREFVQGAGRRP